MFTPFTARKTNSKVRRSPKSMVGSDVFPIEIVPFLRGHSLVFRGVCIYFLKKKNDPPSFRSYLFT